MSDVKKQEIEGKVRDWKAKYDEYAVRQHEADKLKAEADNIADQIVSLMRGLDLDKHKTYYGTISLTESELRVSGHSANYEVTDVPKKRGPGRPKKSESVAEV